MATSMIINALNYYLSNYGVSTPTTPVQISVPNGRKGLLFTIGSTDAISSAYLLFTSANGSPSAHVIKSASDVSITCTTNNVKVSVGSGTYVYALWFE